MDMRQRRPVELRHARRGTEVFRILIANCLDQVLANASILAQGHVDDDVVHQLRIGIRRLRTIWRELPHWHGRLGAQWEPALAGLFRTLGELRDRKTVVAAMQAELVASGSPDPELHAGPGYIPTDPVAAVRSAGVQQALLDLRQFVMLAEAAVSASPEADNAAPDGDAVSEIADRLEDLHAKLRRNAKRFDRFDELRRHRARKQLKRLRYLSELTRALFKRGAVERYLEHLQTAQDEVGRYMDLVVAEQIARQDAQQGSAGAWFNVGWLSAKLPTAVKRCTRSLRGAASAKPYWRAALRLSTRRS